MSKVKSFQLMIALLILTVLPCSIQAKVSEAPKVNSPDLIRIDLPAQAAGEKMPAVDFLHGLHNKAVEGKCAQCHDQKDDAFIFKFKRTDQEPSIELYHDNCIGCHAEKAKAKEATGPLEAQCRSCHGVKSEPSDTSWEKIEFDKSLHFTHETSKHIRSVDSSMTDNCSACHHEYNEKTKETYYKKGEESSCVYCHKDMQTDGVRALRNAAHDSCVACHAKLEAKQVSAGPVSCYGCHDEKEQAKLQKVEDIPRLKRNQPDEVLMTGLISKGDTPKYLMTPVAFNHKLHETRTQSCKACHHETLKKCDDCHTPKGDEKGNFIRLEQAMHSVKSDQSCVGCHNESTKTTDCAGCHDLQTRTEISDNSCKSCHNLDDTMVIADKKMQQKAAAEMLAKSASGYETVMADKIPEIVVIDELADEYKASSFPHRKVVQAIFERAEKSSLAKTFHKDQMTLCAGCHHNAPKSLEPVKCASCHGIFTDLEGGKPNLKAAYHGQCITCHQKMQVKEVLPTDCIKCHEKK